MKLHLWRTVCSLLARLPPQNNLVLASREDVHDWVNAWHTSHGDREIDPGERQTFLRSLGCLGEAPRPSAAMRPDHAS